MDDKRECPYCLDPIGDDADVQVCESCATPHHRECWDENGGCCVPDCPKASRIIDIDLESGTLDLSREAVEAAIPHKTVRVRNPCIRCGRDVPEGMIHCENCEPEPPENQDIKNTGPLIVMIVLLGFALAALVVVLTNLGRW